MKGLGVKFILLCENETFIVPNFWLTNFLVCIQCLDGTEVTRSERIAANQGLEELRMRVLEQEDHYLRKTAHEKEEEEAKKKQAEESGSRYESCPRRWI